MLKLAVVLLVLATPVFAVTPEDLVPLKVGICTATTEEGQVKAPCALATDGTNEYIVFFDEKGIVFILLKKEDGTFPMVWSRGKPL